MRTHTCTLLTVALLAGAAMRPAGAAPLSTRLNERSLAGRSQTPLFDGWPPKTAARKPPDRKSSDSMTVGDSNNRGPLSLIVLGGGVVAGGVGVVFGMKNSSAKSDFNNAQTAVARSSARDRAASAATVANISWIASGVLLATGLGLLFFTDL